VFVIGTVNWNKMTGVFIKVFLVLSFFSTFLACVVVETKSKCYCIILCDIIP